MGKSEDTEITLGTGKLLLLFFGLVALCALFFGLGFTLGKGAARPALADTSPPSGAASNTRPSAEKAPAASPTSGMGFYKAVEEKDPNPVLTTPVAVNNPKDANSLPQADAAGKTADPVSPPPVSGTGYFVQVAAVSKQEDAESLVDALKKKQYPAFSAAGPADKLFRVQVGPYGDIKEAEAIRAKLTGDGYSPILKK
ncbi:MAG: SPOR domain-containing protein [Acidobacteria bacterium]|nr:SPOR domain-containing protein [Acidobacteriota bacterium]